MNLPTIKLAVQSYEEKKAEVESTKNELSSFDRLRLTSDQRSRRNYLELLLRTQKSELFSAELTIAEVQWYGEGKTV